MYGTGNVDSGIKLFTSEDGGTGSGISLGVYSEDGTGWAEQQRPFFWDYKEDNI